MTHRREFIYRIDENDRINFVNDAWISFARQNGAQDLDSTAILNKSLWDFIADRETRHIFEILLKKLKSDRNHINLSYRCDSPDCRRFMEMEISSRQQPGIEFRSWIVKEESRPFVPLMKAEVNRTDDFVRMCSWCKKIHIKDDLWQEVEEATESLKLFNESQLPGITHTICPPCSENLLSKTE